MDFRNPDTDRRIFLPAPEKDTQYGFWLSDGSALLVSYDGSRAVTRQIMTAELAAGKSLYVLPVKK